MYTFICPECKNSFESNIKSRKFCSNTCSNLNRHKNKEFKKIFSEKCKKAKKLKPTVLSEESRKIIGGKNKGKIPWNKGKMGFCSDETKRKISVNNKGGRCSWYEITRKDGLIIKVQGTWEFRFAKVLNEIDKNWIKPTIHNRNHQFQWIDEGGVSHWYTPDFWSPRFQKYFEIKGFWTKDQSKKKKFIESLNNVEIIYEKELIEWEVKNAQVV